jgi:GMP synthase (glutamine-hydrolysing)
MQKVLVLDFGSQYNQLIARRVRELKVYCEVHPFNLSAARVKAMKPAAVILTGGPASVSAVGRPAPDPGILKLGIPTLGICYGMQIIADLLGGAVSYAEVHGQDARATSAREYGHARLEVMGSVPARAGRPCYSALFAGLPRHFQVWMSHGDSVLRAPPGFRVTARTSAIPIAAFADPVRKIHGVQFHPEVAHTPRGKEVFANFLFRVAGCQPTWNMTSFIAEKTLELRRQIGKSKVVAGLSGGVDSSVMAALLARAIGDQLITIFVDNGLLRRGEREEVRAAFSSLVHGQDARATTRFNLRIVDAEARFLRRLQRVRDPERKRKIIGNEFIRVFEQEALRLGGIEYLAQGTLYPDLIESRSAFGGPSATIKSHHNVGGLPERMHLKLIEPLKELFKDEVRVLGRALGLPEEIIQRQPFPGPGLAVRIVGPVTKRRLEILRGADAILLEEIRRAGYYERLWQSFAVLLPVKTVGVMGDERTYESVIVLRAVTSQDAMTADWADLPHELVARISNRIVAEVKGVNRVVYDVSSKPPSTIEWE